MQITVMHRSISSEAALSLATTARLLANEQGLSLCVAVVNRHGQLQAFARIDGAPLHSTNIAMDKAYTAVSFGRETSTWQQRLAEAPLFLQHGLMHRERFAGFGGGFPLFMEGELIGAIGVSGGTVAQDMEIAKAAVEASQLQIIP